MKLAEEIRAIADMARNDEQPRAAEKLDRIAEMAEKGNIADAKLLSDSMVQRTLRLVSWSGAFDHAVMARDLLKGT